MFYQAYRYAFFLSIFCLFFVIPLHAASASTIYANSSTGNDSTGDGSASTPYKTFHQAYSSASSGDTIHLTGTFTWTDADETGDVATSGYTINKNLTITGLGMSQTIVQSASASSTADRSVFTISGGRTVTIQYLTVQNGVRTSDYGAGGITNNGTVTIRNAKISDNLYLSASSYGGGGIFGNSDSTTNLDEVIVTGNTFNGKYYGSAGMYLLQSTNATITDSTFYQNTAISSNPNTYTYSYAEPSGGFGTFRFGTVTISNSTFSQNTTNAYGGAMQIYYKSAVYITNCTIANNTAGYGAGGILYESSTNGYNIHLKNSILANNTAGGSPNDFAARDTSSGSYKTDNGYNIVEYSTNATFSGTGDLTGDQASLNLATEVADNSTANGTPTLALSAGSVAINAGDSDNVANSGVAIPTVDQRNASRNGTTDIGAYEYGGTGLDTVYTLTYSAGANGSLSGSTTQMVLIGSDGSAVTAVPSSNYMFSSWSDGSTLNPRTDIDVSADITVTANFTLQTYALTYTAGTGGSISGSSSQTISHGSDGSAVTAVPNTGYTFVNWSDSSTDNPRTDTGITSDLSVTANFLINTYTITYSAGANGSLSGSTTQMITHGSDGTAVTAVADSGYAFSSWSDSSTDNPRTDTAVTGSATLTASFSDATAPTISSVASSTNSSTATISWTTSEIASSRAIYGPSSDYGSATAITDTSPRVLSHSVILSDLPSCSLYHYAVVSADADGNATTSTDATFTTTGCTGSSAITISESASAATTTTSTVSLVDATLGANLELVLPPEYAPTSTTVQLKQLNATTVLSSTGNPSGYTGSSAHVYDLTAITDDLESVSSFSKDLSITIDYADSDISGLQESTLWIFYWTGSAWSALTSCTLDTSANSITCLTNHFTTFGLFGTATTSDSSSSTTGSLGYIPEPSIGTGERDVFMNMGDTGSLSTMTTTGLNYLAYLHTTSSFSAWGSASDQLHTDSIALTGMNLTLQRIQFRLASSLPAFSLLLGEQTIIDFDRDGIKDLLITFTDLLINRAELTITAIRDEAIDRSEDTQHTNDSPSTPATSSCDFVFTRNLRFGSTGEDVRTLQSCLANLGFPLRYADGTLFDQTTTYFGAMTRDALIRYQASVQLPAYGYFGPMTRALLAE